MKRWVLGVAFLGAAAASFASPQADCPSGRPFRLISTLNPVVGQSPLWVTTGVGPIAWEGPNQSLQVFWIRDLVVKGPAVLTGKARTGTAKVRFAAAALGAQEERYRLDTLGLKPSTVKEADLKRYSFHSAHLWFPTAGCYEITARVGSQQSLIYLNVASGTEAAPKKKPR